MQPHSHWGSIVDDGLRSTSALRNMQRIPLIKFAIESLLRRQISSPITKLVRSMCTLEMFLLKLWAMRWGREKPAR